MSEGVPGTKDGLITEHLACAACGYDRFGTAPDGTCPECGGAGYTAHFRGRRRVRRLAGAVLCLAVLQLGLALGVRGCLAYRGVSFEDFGDIGTTTPMSARGLRAAPLLELCVYSTNALCCGAPILTVLALLLAVVGMRFTERRGTVLALLAILILAAAMWLGSVQSRLLDKRGAAACPTPLREAGLKPPRVALTDGHKAKLRMSVPKAGIRA